LPDRDPSRQSCDRSRRCARRRRAKTAVAIACYPDGSDLARLMTRNWTSICASRPCARGADVVAWRRPAGLAQRTAQACALCPQQGRDHARRCHDRRVRCVRAEARPDRGRRFAGKPEVVESEFAKAWSPLYPA
jgi:hypothetical protein